MSIIGKNKEGRIEVYLREELTYKVFDFKEYNRNFMKSDKDWAKNVAAVSPQDRAIFFLLNDGTVKKLYTAAKHLMQKLYKNPRI